MGAPDLSPPRIRKAAGAASSLVGPNGAPLPLSTSLATYAHNGEAWTGGVYAPLPCGCEVTGNGTSPNPLTVRLCAAHAALEVSPAPDTDSGDFRTSHLVGTAKYIANLIVQWMVAHNNGRLPCGGGCTTFYSTEAWQAKEGKGAFGLNSLLICCHDGGDFAPMANMAYEDPAYGEFDTFLRSKGFYMEACTGWYSAVYRLADER